MVTPIGPLSVDINSSVTINCSVTNPESFNWHYKSSSDVPGIKIICSTLSSSLTIHVMNISITGLQCREYVYNRHGNPIFRSGKTVQLLVHGMLIL